MQGTPTLSAQKTFQFGDTPALADRLAALVVAGVKTGTCSAAVHGPDAEVGDRQICLSGAGLPVCEIETLSLQTLRFDEVPPELSVLEGEGDLSHRYWREAHEAYFAREGTWTPEMEVIFEIFKVTRILDPDLADRASEIVAAERDEAIANGYTALGGENG